MRPDANRLRLPRPLLVVALALCGGCATMQRVPPTPLQVTFAADQPFRITSAPTATPEDGTAAARATCDVRRVDVRFSAVRNDTVFFDHLVAHRTARGASRCTLTGPGIIDLATQPQVRAERGRVTAGRTALGVVMAVFGTVGLYLLVAAVTGNLRFGT